jgi:hypothetical protein
LLQSIATEERLFGFAIPKNALNKHKYRSKAVFVFVCRVRRKNEEERIGIQYSVFGFCTSALCVFRADTESAHPALDASARLRAGFGTSWCRSGRCRLDASSPEVRNGGLMPSCATEVGNARWMLARTMVEIFSY